MITIKPSGGFLAVSFRYNAEYVELIKAIPGRVYDKASASWMVPISQARKLLDTFPIVKVDGEIPALSELEAPRRAERETYLATIRPIYDLAFKTAPRPHQVEGYNTILRQRRVLLADEMGTGKTKQALDAFGALRDHIPEPFLVIVGINGLKYNWQTEEIPKHSRLSSVVIEGTKAKRLKLIDQVKAGDFDIAVINAEALRVGEVLDALASITWAAIVIDECHKAGFKNPRSVVGRAIQQLHAEWQVAMTGTPIMNRPDEAYNMLYWLGYERRRWWSFLHDLCIYGGFNGKEVVGYRPAAVRELQAKIRLAMLRRLKRNVLDLPPKTVQTRYVELAGDQAALYKRVVNQTLEELDDPTLTAVNALAKTLRLRQVLSLPELFSPGMEGAKVGELLNMLEEITAGGGKALIYSNWTSITRPLLDKLAAYSPAYITGEVDAGKRMDEAKRFQTDPNCKVALGTIGAMGTGYTLTAASYVIFLDWDLTPGNNEQAEDRAHRAGTKWPVNVIYLAVRDSVDDRLLAMLTDKQSLFDAVIDGKLQGGQAKALVRYLVGGKSNG